MKMGWESLKCLARLIAVVGALMAFFTPADALAQRSGGEAPADPLAQPSGRESPADSLAQRSGREAPVGHRQPSADDVKGAESGPGLGTTPDLEKQNEQLDKRLREICRGC